MEQTSKTEKVKILMLILCCSAVFLAIASMTSFLYPLNNKVDQNCFLTVGKGILQGRVPYRDMFEQKGPIVYFLHALALVIVPDSFNGVYVLQVISMTIFMWYAYKTSNLYLSKRQSVFASISTAVAIMVSHCFLRGDNVEEFCMPLLMIGVYHILSHIKNSKDGEIRCVPNKILFINGFFAGCVLWIKFTLLGFWGAWMLFVWNMIYLTNKTPGQTAMVTLKKSIGKIMASSAVFLVGMAVTAIPWIIYFGIHNAIYDWLYVYFYANIFLYSRDYLLLFKPIFMIGTFFVNGFSNPLILVLLVGAFKGFGWKKSKSKIYCNELEKKFLLFTCIFLYIGLYIGMVLYRYYFLIVSPFAVFGIIYLMKRFEPKLEKMKKKLKVRLVPITAVFFLSVVVIFGNNTSFYFKSKSDYVQFQFAEIIKKETPKGETPLILNANFIDGGFFFATNTMPPPQTKYFSQVNIPHSALPEMGLENRKLIRDKTPNFVVTRTKKPNADDLLNFPEIYEHYEKIAVGVNKTDKYNYHLYKRK